LKAGATSATSAESTAGISGSVVWRPGSVVASDEVEGGEGAGVGAPGGIIASISGEMRIVAFNG
jgi:hypothetical protein